MIHLSSKKHFNFGKNLYESTNSLIRETFRSTNYLKREQLLKREREKEKESSHIYTINN